MATRAVLLPLAAEPPLSGAAEVKKLAANGRPVVAYDAAIGEGMRWTFVAPQGIAALYTLRLIGMMASATSGQVQVGAAIEAVTPGDVLDLDAAESFDAVNLAASGTVPSTAGYSFLTTILLNNVDSIAPGDYVRVEIMRDATSASDTAAGDYLLLAAELRDSS